ncbi:MAG TPA: GlxA family transcriptional regulator [Stellaceae bacterium]|nr:GlxA family transcriptional regulator [Stellaceae bacterium]
MTHTVGVLIFPDFQLLDAAGPITVFEAAGRETAPSSYRLRVIARTAGPIASSSGAQLVAEAFSAAPLDTLPLDTLIVAGGWGTRQASSCADTLDFVRAASRRVPRLASVCSGAFILGAAGLLDGRRATTHWARAAEFARTYPQIRVEPDRIFIRDGAVWTSAGITAGIDLALAMVAEDVGEAVAKRAAQQLVVYHRRPGGQSQFSALLDVERPSSRFAPLLAWARERLGERLSVDRLADRAAMSPRHFARAFTAEIGVTPATAIERLRLEAARERVESGPEPIEGVAELTGFGDPERMRRAFLRAFGQPPQALRRAARAAAAAPPLSAGGPGTRRARAGAAGPSAGARSASARRAPSAAPGARPR